MIEYHHFVLVAAKYTMSNIITTFAWSIIISRKNQLHFATVGRLPIDWLCKADLAKLGDYILKLIMVCWNRDYLADICPVPWLQYIIHFHIPTISCSLLYFHTKDFQDTSKCDVLLLSPSPWRGTWDVVHPPSPELITLSDLATPPILPQRKIGVWILTRDLHMCHDFWEIRASYMDSDGQGGEKRRGSCIIAAPSGARDSLVVDHYDEDQFAASLAGAYLVRHI